MASESGVLAAINARNGNISESMLLRIFTQIVPHAYCIPLAFLLVEKTQTIGKRKGTIYYISFVSLCCILEKAKSQAKESKVTDICFVTCHYSLEACL